MPEQAAALPYVATCQDPECYMHKAPSRFADYDYRARIVGEHRVKTGHSVKMHTEKPEEISD